MNRPFARSLRAERRPGSMDAVEIARRRFVARRLRNRNTERKQATVAHWNAQHRDALERAVAGALRCAIHDHGPITMEWIGSAAKRVVGNLRSVAPS